MIDLTGFTFVIGGIAWVLIVVGVRTRYVMNSIVICAGGVILAGVTHSRTKDNHGIPLSTRRFILMTRELCESENCLPLTCLSVQAKCMPT